MFFGSVAGSIARTVVQRTAVGVDTALLGARRVDARPFSVDKDAFAGALAGSAKSK